MSLKTVGNLKDGVAGMVTGTNLDKITNLYRVFERAASKLVLKADIPEASLKETLVLYDGVYNYPCSELIFGGALIDIQPQGVTRWFNEDVQKMPIRRFDQTKTHPDFGVKATFEHRNGTPIVRVSSIRPKMRTVIDDMHQTTDWTQSGSASAVSRDATVFFESPASLRFTLTGSDTGILTKALSTTFDLEDYEDVAVGFLALRIPDGADVSALTSIAVRFGSSSTDYNEVSTTQGFLGAWTAGDWLLVAFDFSGATETGTPDWSALDYLQFRFAHTATFTNIRVGGFWLSLPSPHEMLFYTSAIFLEDTTRSTTITDDDTQIVLNDAAYALYEHECAIGVAQQTKQKELANELRNILYVGEGDVPSLYDAYRGDNPSNEIRQVGSYYDEI